MGARDRAEKKRKTRKSKSLCPDEEYELFDCSSTPKSAPISKESKTAEESSKKSKKSSITKDRNSCLSEPECGAAKAPLPPESISSPIEAPCSETQDSAVHSVPAEKLSKGSSEESDKGVSSKSRSKPKTSKSANGDSTDKKTFSITTSEKELPAKPESSARKTKSTSKKSNSAKISSSLEKQESPMKTPPQKKSQKGSSKESLKVIYDETPDISSPPTSLESLGDQPKEITAILDGRQVGYDHGGDNFSPKGIEIALKYLKRKGVRAIAAYPDGESFDEDCKAVVDRLRKRGAIQLLPRESEFYLKRLLTDAFEKKYLLFSNVRNWRLKEMPQERKIILEEYLNKYLIPYVFIRDDFQPNPDPSRLGSSVYRAGKPVEQPLARS